jgi:hypothetical protein
MLKRLRTIDKRFEVWVDRGKGSHRMIVLETGATKKHYPFPCHDDGTEIAPHYLRDILKYFDLPRDLFD